jgi:hypothetical protein
MLPKGADTPAELNAGSSAFLRPTDSEERASAVPGRPAGGAAAAAAAWSPGAPPPSAIKSASASSKSPSPGPVKLLLPHRPAKLP